MSELEPGAHPDKERSKTDGETWIIHFFKAASYSFAGIKAALKVEMAFRMEVFAFIVLLPLALLVPVTMTLKAMVIGSMLLVLVVELLNSSMEWVVDYISLDRHPLAKRAKDMGSAAVFFALVNAGVMWTCVLIEFLGKCYE